jgi:RHS repeat-associated protein
MTQPVVCTSDVCFAPSCYTGKERDSESGNDYFGARYYASSMGRFMSPDWSAKEDPVPYAQLDDPQSLNLYSYVRNNPLTRVDADGHDGDGCCDFPISIEEPGIPPLPNPFHPLVPYPEKYTLTPEKLEQGWNDAADSILSAFQSAKNTVTGWFSKKAAPPPADDSATGPKAADAPCVTCNGQAANPKTGEKLGPSGNEVGHSTRHNTKKGAKEAAARRSKNGKVRNDAKPADGRGGHFHPDETDNEGSEHHYYPKKNNP